MSLADALFPSAILSRLDSDRSSQIGFVRTLRFGARIVFGMSSAGSSQNGFVRTLEFCTSISLVFRSKTDTLVMITLESLGSQGVDISRINTLISCRLRHLKY